MKIRIILLLVAVMVLSAISVAQPSQTNPFENCENWKTTWLHLELEEDNTVTATLLFRGEWRKNAFTDWIQSETNQDVLKQLELYWASDITGWSPDSPNWWRHDTEYYDKWIRNGDTVLVELFGIPYPEKDVIKGQFFLRNTKKKEDAEIVEMWLNPVFVCNQDEYFVPDCQDPQGYIIHGKFDGQDNFITQELHCPEQ